MPVNFRLKALAAAMAMAVVPTAFAANSTMVKVAGPMALHQGDLVTGAVPASQPMHIEVALKLRNQDALHAFLAAAHNPSLLIAKRTMTPAEFHTKHSPTANQTQAVVNYLKSAGFTNVTVSPNNMLVSGDATADVVKAAFSTTFAHVRTARGKEGFANTSEINIPTALKDSVLSVIGLQDVHRPHTFIRTLSGLSPQAITGHYPTEFSSIYGGSGQTTGAGVTVGIITQGKITQTITDLNSFTSQHSLPTVSTQTINTNGTSTDTSGLGEWNLDSQDIVGAAGGQVGGIIFYNIPTLSNANLTADINKVVSDNQVKVINVSLGECETYTQQDGSAAADDQLFQQAVAQGQTFSVSSGDDGADECGDGGITPSYPASSPYVVSVGGTTLNASTTTWSSEVVWNDLSSNEGATGGSPSTFESKPSWQSGVSGTKRGVPDIAFDASPNSGAKVIVSGSTEQIGGTSLAAPIFSGIWARVLAAKGTGVGFAGPLLYQLPSSDFHDITSGNNSGETAGAGYDFTTGRGSLIISQLLADVGGGGGGSNASPVANFSDTVSGLAVNFTDSSTDSDGTIASRSWNFGDGSTSTATNPSHTYAASGSYTVTLTVTDNDGATDTTTQTVTVSSGGGGSGSQLQNGVALTGQSAASGADLNYTVAIPSGASNLVITISGGSGDADLYTKFGSVPTSSSYDCRPYVTGNNETCTYATTQAGTYYVRVHGYSAFSNVTVKATWSTGGGGGGGNVLQNGVPVTGLSGAKNAKLYYTVVVPAGASNLAITTSGGTGDEDLYVKQGSQPTTSSYDCRPYVTGNSESCTTASPTAGTYYIMLNGYTAFSGVTLQASWN